MIKTFARILSITSTLLGGMTLVRPRRGPLVGMMLAPKLIAGAFAPFTAIAGAIGTLLGIFNRDPCAVIAGLVGTLINTRYVKRVTAPHTGFEQAFGPDWESHIPPELQTRMQRSRWMLIQPDPPQIPWEQNVVFGTHVETRTPLLADVWQPPNNGLRTGLGIIYLHGSGWVVLNKDIGTRRFFGTLANQGHVVMDVAYTLAPQTDMRGMLNDVHRAIAWMKENAKQYGVDPERIILTGGSAGGHLALLAAFTAQHPQFQTPDVKIETSVRAVISLYGVTDLTNFQKNMDRTLGEFTMGRTQADQKMTIMAEKSFKNWGWLAPEGKLVPGQQMVSTALRGTLEEKPDDYRLFSPITHVGPHCPPTLCLHGLHDMGNLAPGGRRLHQALCDAGVRSIYIDYPNTEHAFDLIFPKFSPSAQSAMYDVERFLALMV